MGRGARREGEFGGGHEDVEHDEGGPPACRRPTRLFFTVVEDS